jgi:hypothetical protein
MAMMLQPAIPLVGTTASQFASISNRRKKTLLKHIKKLQVNRF